MLFNVAQCYRNLKKFEDTLKTFKQYMILVSESDESLAENVAGLRRIQALLPDIEAENDFPKKNTTVKKILKENKDLVNLLLNKAAALPKPSALSISGTKDADVYLDDIKLEGKTPLDVLKAKKGSHKLSVKKDGYFSWSKNFDVSGDGKAIAFSVELVPLILEVTGTPGADVLINGELKGKIPFRLEGIKAGAYKLSVRMLGHKDWSTDVILPGNDQNPVALSAELTPLTLKIEGPSDVELSLDGDLQGKLPLTIEKISIGKHKLTAKKDGFEEWVAEITITNENTLYEQKVELKPTKIVKNNGGKDPGSDIGADKSGAAFALYGVSAVALGGGAIALVGSFKAKSQALALLDLNQPSVIDLVEILDKQSSQLGLASVGAFAVAAGAGVGGFLLSKKSSKTVNLQVTPSSVALSGRF